MDLISHSENVNKSEQIKQLNREKESILLEIDIIKQLKVSLREDIKKKTADLVKLSSFTLPPSPPNERVKNKRMKYWYV